MLCHVITTQNVAYCDLDVITIVSEGAYVCVYYTLEFELKSSTCDITITGICVLSDGKLIVYYTNINYTCATPRQALPVDEGGGHCQQEEADVCADRAQGGRVGQVLRRGYVT